MDKVFGQLGLVDVLGYIVPGSFVVFAVLQLFPVGLDGRPVVGLDANVLFGAFLVAAAYGIGFLCAYSAEMYLLDLLKWTQWFLIATGCSRVMPRKRRRLLRLSIRECCRYGNLEFDGQLRQLILQKGLRAGVVDGEIKLDDDDLYEILYAILHQRQAAGSLERMLTMSKFSHGLGAAWVLTGAILFVTGARHLFLPTVALSVLCVVSGFFILWMCREEWSRISRAAAFA